MRKLCSYGSRRRNAALLGAWAVLVGVAIFKECGVFLGALQPATPASVTALGSAQPTGDVGTDSREDFTLAIITSNASCTRTAGDVGYITPRELDLQQRRRCWLEKSGARLQGYAAICATVRNQHADLGEWLDYHRRLGVSHVYVMDDHSDPPLDDVLAPYLRAGYVTHFPLPDPRTAQRELLHATCHRFHLDHKQLMAYGYCLRNYGARHQWMAFIDVDEFLVLTDDTPDLPTLLHDYERFGGLAVNWRMFGSSGHKQRQASTLRAYTKCYHPDNPENTHIKTIANLHYMVRMAGPHDVFFPPGYYAVQPSGGVVAAPLTAAVDYSRLVLHHYAVKSEEEYAEKQARGDVMGDQSKLAQGFWDRIEQGSTENCTAGIAMLERFEKAAGTHKDTGRRGSGT